MQKYLETDRTRLELLKESDYEELMEMYLEPDTWKFIEPLNGLSHDEYHSFLLSRQQLVSTKSGFYWVGRIIETNELIGAINITPFRDTEKIQLGFQIKRKFWGYGFATEMSKKVLKWSIESGISPIYAFFECDHHASRKILKKLGFQFIEQINQDGESKPLEVFHFHLK